MKLSKQERIAAIALVVLVILVAGVFLFIKPNIETINATKSTLEFKEREYNNAVDRVATKDSLRTQIISAYDDGKNLADMFFPELASYELDNEFRAFLDTTTAKVYIEDLEVSAPATASLSSYMYTPPSVEYALKDYVNQGGTDPSADDPRIARQEMIRSALGEAQTIGASTVTFKVKAISQDEILKFADEVNRYQKSENGKNVRKAVELSGLAISYPLITDLYNILSDALLLEAELSAVAAFKEETGLDLKGFEDFAEMAASTPNTPTLPEAGADGEAAVPPAVTGGDEEENFVDIALYLYEMECSVTFYSIERMSDPTPILDDQDRAVTA